MATHNSTKNEFYILPEHDERRIEPNGFGFFLSILLSPVVFILTKIGEITVKSILGIFHFGKSFISIPFRVLRRVTLPHIAMPKFSPLALPVISLPKGKKKKIKPVYIEIEKKIYVIPFFTKFRYFVSGLFVASLLLTPVIVRLWLAELPSPNRLAVLDTALSTKIYDRNGIFLFQFYGTQNRSHVPLHELPRDLINATVAIEDKNFYQHHGFDVAAIARAARETLVNKNLQGGSTLTQQLIKSTLLNPEVSLERKVKEIILALWTEQMYSKNEILEMYFNQVPYGGTAWGVEAAAQTYFGKNSRDLTLAESALLAGLPSAPTVYSPFGAHPELARQRQKEVLSRMASLGYITQAQADEAFEQEPSYTTPTINIKAPHFVMFVKNYLVRHYGIRTVEQGGLRVTTTLDLSLQEQAQTIVRNEIEKLAHLSVGNGGVLITNPQTGEILAMVGSRDYFDEKREGNVNVTTALRQPGSSIKVVTYATALEKGITAAAILDDSPITYNVAGSPPYSPVNYDGRFHGKITLRDALGNSYNVPAVKTLAQVGVPAMIQMGKRLGITTWEDENRFGLSLTLGGGEVKMTDMATIYGVLATGGIRNNLTPVLEVTDAEGNILEQKTPQLPGDERRVLSEGIAFILSDILADNDARSAAFGPSSILRIPGMNVAVKTGTSDNKRDNWTIGFTRDLLVAVWVGNNNNTPMNPALTSGITGAAPIWNKLMTTVLASRPIDPINDNAATPSEIVAVPVCKINGLLACGGCPTRTEYFVQGTEPKTACRPEFLTPAPAIGGQEPSTNP